MNVPVLKQNAFALLLGLLSLVAVYLPTFLLVSLLIKSGALGTVSKSEMEVTTAPWIILLSAALALTYMALLARRRGQSLKDFGLKTTTLRYLSIGLGIGLVCGLALHILLGALPLGAGPELRGLTRWRLIVYFLIGAPIQEELIFRGLIQSVAERAAPHSLKLGRLELRYSVLVSAVLFGLVHLATVSLGASWPTVAFTMGGAFVLALIAGSLRWKSGSVLPGILVHALFNLFGGA